MSVVGMGLGIACIVDSFGVISVALAFVGLALIYDGITDIWIVSRIAKTAKSVKQQVDEFHVVETEAEVITEDVTEESEM